MRHEKVHAVRFSAPLAAYHERDAVTIAIEDFGRRVDRRIDVDQNFEISARSLAQPQKILDLFGDDRRLVVDAQAYGETAVTRARTRRGIMEGRNRNR